TQLSDEILEALGSQDYVDYLVELALVSAAAKVAPAPAVVGAPVAATPVEASPAPEAEPLFEPEPEVPAEPVVELSAPEEAPMEPSSAETSSELRDRLVAELEAQSPRPSIALALVGQHAVVSTKNGGLLVAM